MRTQVLLLAIFIRACLFQGSAAMAQCQHGGRSASGGTSGYFPSPFASAINPYAFYSAGAYAPYASYSPYSMNSPYGGLVAQQALANIVARDQEANALAAYNAQRASARHDRMRRLRAARAQSRRQDSGSKATSVDADGRAATSAGTPAS